MSRADVIRSLPYSDNDIRMT